MKIPTRIAVRLVLALAGSMLLLQLGPWGCGGCDLDVATSVLADAAVGQNYNFALDSQCGGDAWSLRDGSLPPGIDLSEAGILSGTPTLPGTYVFNVEVVELSRGVVTETATRALQLIVQAASMPTPTPSPNPSPTPT